MDFTLLLVGVIATEIVGAASRPDFDLSLDAP